MFVSFVCFPLMSNWQREWIFVFLFVELDLTVTKLSIKFQESCINLKLGLVVIGSKSWDGSKLIFCHLCSVQNLFSCVKVSLTLKTGLWRMGDSHKRTQTHTLDSLMSYLIQTNICIVLFGKVVKSKVATMFRQVANFWNFLFERLTVPFIAI